MCTCNCGFLLWHFVIENMSTWYIKKPLIYQVLWFSNISLIINRKFDFCKWKWITLWTWLWLVFIEWFFYRYYLGLARSSSQNSCDPIPSRLQWIFTPYGYKFFTSQKFSYQITTPSVPFSCLGSAADPLAFVMMVSHLHIDLSFDLTSFAFLIFYQCSAQTIT